MLHLMNFSHVVLSNEMLYFYGIASVSLLFIYVSIPAFILTVQLVNSPIKPDQETKKSKLVNLDL